MAAVGWVGAASPTKTVDNYSWWGFSLTHLRSVTGVSACPIYSV